MLTRFAIVGHAQFDVRPRQGQGTQPFLDMAQLRAFGAQELATRRHVIEQIAHLNRGAGRMRVRRYPAELATFDFQPSSVFGGGRLRGQGKAADRGDRRQRFAAKAQGRHLFQIIERTDLAGGVASDGQRQVLGGDAVAVVTDANQANAAFLQLDVDPPGAGIERVFHQLFDHRRRPLDHFTGGDLVDQGIGQKTNRHAVESHGKTAS
jgi:hypothetical protein